MALKLQMRLGQMQAAETLADLLLVPGARCHALTGNLKGKFAVDLAHPYRLIFSPDHDPLPRKEDGGLILEEVTAVVVQAIKDYH